MRVIDGTRSRGNHHRPILFVLVTYLAAACVSAPPGSHYPKRASVAFAESEQTRVGRQWGEAARDHPNNSAFRIVSVGVDGFATRIQMIDSAERALDLQYFIFRQDTTGTDITAALLRAADRGVHLRILVDDGARMPGDSRIAVLAAHPQVEIRTFNPFVVRSDSRFLRAVEFIFNRTRLDFRMHNKMIVADNASALIGGRNIADAYFQIDPEGQYADDDMFVVGPTVQKLSAKFDEYWNSSLAIPVEALSDGHIDTTKLAKYRRHLERQWQHSLVQGAPYVQRAASGDPMAAMLLGKLPLVWSSALVVCDSPEKKRVAEGSKVGRLMYEPVAKVTAAVQSELLMITPYFIPTPEEMKLLDGLRQRNVRVAILTNSLESTTELSAHSGYTRFRKTLVRSGVELYEVRSLLGNTRGSGQTAKISRSGNYGLHAKLFVFDRQKLFVGSMNFDQRSARLNTEVGLILDSAELSEQTAARFAAMTQPANAYAVMLQPNAAGNSKLVWRTQEAGKSVEYTHEPSDSVWRRIAVQLLKLLPLDSEL